MAYKNYDSDVHFGQMAPTYAQLKVPWSNFLFLLYL